MTGSLRRSPALLALVTLVAAFTVAPLGVAVLVGFSASPFLVFPPPGLGLRWFARFLADPSFMAALWVSVKLAAFVTVAGVALGVAAACGVRRIARQGARRALEAGMLLPLLFPVIVLALALLLTLADVDGLGSWLGLALAHLLIVVPLTIATVKAALASLDPQLEEAAASLGAGPWRVILHVVLPQVRATIAGTALLAFLFSFNDVTFAAFVGGPDAQTLPLKLFAYVRYQINPLIGAVSALFVGATLVAILLLERLVGFTRLIGLKE